MLHILTSTYHVIDPLFGRPECPVELDMGCGKGGFTLALAKRFPDRVVIGADIMVGRLRRIARKGERAGLENLELLRAENVELAGFQLPDNSIDRVHLLCPDPWPKNRHRHFRLITSDFIARLRRILKPGGTLHLATDHPPYRETLAIVMEQLDFYVSDPSLIADIADIQTDFERKWLREGKTVPHLAYRLKKS